MTVTRRKFITYGATSLAGAAVMPSSVFAILKDNPIRLGLIGYGQRGSGVAKLLAGIKSIRLTAICDVDEKRLSEARSQLGDKDVKYYNSYNALLSDKKIDAVIIATPLYSHYQISSDSLAANKHVYVEKTMTFNVFQALKMVEIVSSTKMVFQVGHQYRYYDMYHEIKKIIDKGWLGEISHIESQYNRHSDWRRPVGLGQSEKVVNWRLYREFSGGLMAELCAHQIDVVNWLLDGPPLKVAGFGGIDFWKDGRDIYDNVKVIYEYKNGVKSAVTSVSNNQYESYLIRILGSKGTLIINRNNAYFYPEPTSKTYGVVDGVTGATMEVKSKGDGVEIKYGSADGLKSDPTVYALMDFAECILKNKKPFCGVVAGKDTAIAVHMANEAMRTGHVQYWKKEYDV